MPAATPRAPGPDTRDPSPAPPCRWPVTPCPRRRCTTAAVRRSGHRQRSHGLARRSRTTWCAGRCAWLPGRGHRRVMRRRSFGRAPNSVAPRRCRGWSPTLRRACASRRRRADHRRPPDARRSAPRSRRPIRGSRCFDRGGQPPVQLGAIGFELGFVGHRTDQRMAERVLSRWGEADLIDQLDRGPIHRRQDQRPAR